jgi:alkane 1-monooxygenase
MIREMLRYILSFLLPFLVIIDFHFKLAGFWLGPIVAFVFIPALEQALPRSTSNFKSNKNRHFFFHLLLFLNLPVVLGIASFGLNLWLNHKGVWLSGLGILISTGLVLGVNGINVAHELGHRSDWPSKIAAWILLLPSFYLHFYIEHNWGHHRYVSTERDPATARFNETIYVFWLRSIWGSWKSAWEIEKEMLGRKGRSVFSILNRMSWFSLAYLMYGLALVIFGGKSALFFGLFSGLIGILLLETVNYIEHYGLTRRKLVSGHYETVKPWHSWNSDHRLGRAVLYDLTRHSDHHYKASKPYQLLEHRPEAPALPLGYPGSMVLSLFPPLWFRTMNPRIELLNKSLSNAVPLNQNM